MARDSPSVSIYPIKVPETESNNANKSTAPPAAPADTTHPLLLPVLFDFDLDTHLQVLYNPRRYGLEAPYDVITVTPPYEEVVYAELVKALSVSDVSRKSRNGSRRMLVVCSML